ncbi:MAG: DUF2852 domain-containing protein [Methylobacteriaceae bacterium]|nr:DUF2852 domain-containing protein [Methylobacteriaceae bacterium]
MSCASHQTWNAGSFASSPRGRRALEIVGLVFAFIHVWPLALAYIAWKFAGYPVPAGWRDWAKNGPAQAFNDLRWNAAGMGSSGNRAFDEYRRAELERLEAERRKLDDEARSFREFVEELKRAKDREEFDAFMARRRGSTNG